MTMGIGIAGVGAYLPERVVTNRDLLQSIDRSDAWIVGPTGIHERRIAEHGVARSDLAAAAADAAIRNAGRATRPTASSLGTRRLPRHRRGQCNRVRRIEC
jgi:3-oxoacyl-[acyl-carrier-protein] synthase III